MFELEVLEQEFDTLLSALHALLAELKTRLA
jgi:hypothetical protein